MTSQIKTVFLLVLLSGIIFVIGGAVGGRAGLLFALGIALVMNVGSYWYSDKIVLRMYKAREVSASEAPMLHAAVEELAANAGIPKPKVCIVPDQTPNAFATGRNPENAVVAVTEGILRTLNPEELKGVLAHEIAHIANRDILIQSVAGVMATAIMFLGNMLRFTAIFGGRSNQNSSPIAAIALAIIAPIAAALVQMAISRSREYLADATGARYCHNPKALASALNKLSTANQMRPMQEGNQATAHICIVAPFSGQKSMASLFSTHPPMEERIRRLQAMQV